MYLYYNEATVDVNLKLTKKFTKFEALKKINMKRYYSIIGIFVLFFITSTIQGQNLPIYYQSNNIKVYDQLGIELKNPFFGGLAFPVFTQMEINGDNKEDLIILDRVDDRLLILINQTTDPNKPQYLFSPHIRKILS